MQRDGNSDGQRDGHSDGQWDGLKGANHNSPGHLSAVKNPIFTTLVIEGNASFAGFLEEFFRTEGHYIIRANSSSEALAKTREYRPDLILLDNEVEGVDALALLPELLMQQASAAIVVMAGHPSITEAVEAMKLGAVDYLERPLDPNKLKRAIQIQKVLFGNQA